MIKAELIGDEEVALRFAQFGPALHDNLVRTMTRLAIDLQRKVVSEKLHGQVLNQRSGALARSINYRVKDEGTSIVASVGTNKEYAAIHEYGGAVQIAAHMRMMTQAFGRPVKNPRQIQVRGYTAQVPERSFLRSSLGEFREKILARMGAAAKRAAKQAMGEG